MKTLKSIKAGIARLQKKYGVGLLGERRVQEFLETETDLDSDQIYDVIDGDAELVMVGKKLTTKPIEVQFDLTITNDNGWLSPDGKFYKCQFHGHSLLAGRISKDYNPEAALEEAGYVKVQRRPWGDQTQWFFHNCSHLDSKLKPTKVQVDLVQEYCIKHCPKDLPYWADPEYIQ